MKNKYPEYKQFDLPALSKEILQSWEDEDTFGKSITSREGSPAFTFYEGPPSANGLPGIHHVMARAIKDIFCRYKTMKGFQVKRKGGWDTHGLPIELSVEKTLGITKEDIGKKITVEEYNAACRKEVMKYKNVWDDLTRKMGYWVDLENPYITFENNYIESVWNLLSRLYDKDLLYKGYSIQPYSPAAGTGLSSHELNQPGCYRMVKDTTAVAMFKALDENDLFYMAWTTTPWTLPSNTALAVGAKISYVRVRTFNPYTALPCSVILAKDRMGAYFSADAAELPMEYKATDKVLPYRIESEHKGAEFVGKKYEQLLPYVQPEDGDAFRILAADFVTIEDGTGIVHLAPSFGSDDFRVARENGIGSLTLVDKRGRFTEEMGEFANEFVKEDYLSAEEKEAERVKQGRDKYLSVDERIAIKLKTESRAFKVEKYEHSYPHCWRTDKPVLYYPLDSWFVKTTALKARMMELNKTINWKPASTGTGRFGNWLENLVDWNLSRSRFWGIPLPIWSSEDTTERKRIGSVAELAEELDKSLAAGFMKTNPLRNEDGSVNTDFDLHRPFVDDLFLVSDSGKLMKRESDLIDVWFDSGAMPYAQWHFPFENEEEFHKSFPADFIAEGVDQTRGWFFTLHAIAVLLFDSVAFKNVISNGLVLDKDGNKMSKRLGNAADPFETLDKYGADATRWYMISNAQPWDNLKFNTDGITEVQRKFFGTLYNTYAFFSLYANIDGFTFSEAEIAMADRPELDRWILSLLNSLALDVDAAYADYEPTKAARLIQDFTNENLSNWYVRLSRRRFWKGDYTADKISAYQTLYICLDALSKMMAPIAPFYSEKLFRDLNAVTGRDANSSVHITLFPNADETLIDKDLEARMDLAQKISSMVLSLRKKVNIRVRQPLNRIMVPVLDPQFKARVESIQDLILSEVNVKELEFITDTAGVLIKKIKPNFKALGPKVGGAMKEVAAIVNGFGQEEIAKVEQQGFIEINLSTGTFKLEALDTEISSEDIPGWQVANADKLTVALDITINEELRQEGLARELVNRIQNLRKDSGLEVTDRIRVVIQQHDELKSVLSNYLDYICSETLADSVDESSNVDGTQGTEIEVEDGISTFIIINKN